MNEGAGARWFALTYLLALWVAIVVVESWYSIALYSSAGAAEADGLVADAGPARTKVLLLAVVRVLVPLLVFTTASVAIVRGRPWARPFAACACLVPLALYLMLVAQVFGLVRSAPPDIGAEIVKGLLSWSALLFPIAGIVGAAVAWACLPSGSARQQAAGQASAADGRLRRP